MSLNWRQQFPALQNEHQPVAYLDSASTCQVPTPVIDAISGYLSGGHGNAHRGMYAFSENADNLYQQCRERVARFINAPAHSDIIFTKSATESINLVALSLHQSLKQNLKQNLTAKHSILVTAMEHHANLLPWQQLCQRTGARLNILPVKTDGTLNTDKLNDYLQDNCILFTISHISNVTGIENDVQRICQLARQYQVPVLIDGAQAVGHGPVDVSAIDCDYYVFSGHKMYATTGIGVLYSKAEAAKTLNPLLLGGGIVNKVTEHHYQLKVDVSQFEAGSANMVGIVALLAAMDFIDHIGWPALLAHQRQLSDYLLNALQIIDNIEIIGNESANQPGRAVYSFVHKQVHSHDIASILAQENIATRAGHHCAQPYLKAMGYKHCVRVSLGCYNTLADVDRLVAGFVKVSKTFT